MRLTGDHIYGLSTLSRRISAAEIALEESLQGRIVSGLWLIVITIAVSGCCQVEHAPNLVAIFAFLSFFLCLVRKIHIVYPLSNQILSSELFVEI